MSFYANQEMLQTIEFERTRGAQARRRLIEARRLARKNRRFRLSHWIDDSAITKGSRRSEDIASSAARHVVAKS